MSETGDGQKADQKAEGGTRLNSRLERGLRARNPAKGGEG